MPLRTLLQRAVPKAWSAQLADFSPPSENISWLRLRWEPGYPWEADTGERWVIDQMIPEAGIDDARLEQLKDFPPPSEMGNYYDAALGEFVRNPDCLITERAWHLYRETGCLATSFWVVQGVQGGHKFLFSNVEKQFLKLANLPPDAPYVGALPYVDFDERVFAQLVKYDMLQSRMRTLGQRKSLLAGTQDAMQEAEERRFREELVSWLADQVTEVAGGVMESLMVLDAPRDDFDVGEMEKRSDQATHNFITTGRSHGGLFLAK
jgi:hypothetical protein